MSPKETTFDRTMVLAAAMKIVRKKGWEHLTARAVADELKASVAPVYSTFGSMEALERKILQEARRLLHESTLAVYTDGAFLNIGVGIVVFARQEPHLFTALFHTRHNHIDIVRSVTASILERMKSDAVLRLLPDIRLESLLHYLGTYTLGLAASVVYGRDTDPSTESIIQRMKNAGSMMIFGEISGLSDTQNSEHKIIWERLLREKNIRLPEQPCLHHEKEKI